VLIIILLLRIKNVKPNLKLLYSREYRNKTNSYSFWLDTKQACAISCVSREIFATSKNVWRHVSLQTIWFSLFVCKYSIFFVYNFLFTIHSSSPTRFLIYSLSLCQSAICRRGELHTSFQWFKADPVDFGPPSSRRPITSFLVTRSQSKSISSIETPSKFAPAPWEMKKKVVEKFVRLPYVESRNGDTSFVKYGILRNCFDQKAFFKTFEHHKAKLRCVN
jgi:hypothetical protein